MCLCVCPPKPQFNLIRSDPPFPQLAPPPSPLQDFEYHWKQVKTFYTVDLSVGTSSSGGHDATSSNGRAATTTSKATLPPPHRCHLADTRIPHHLDQMLELLIAEEQQQQQQNDSVEASVETPPAAAATQPPTTPPCLHFVLTARPLDLLAELAAADTPPGTRRCVLAWMRRFLVCMRRPPLAEPAVLEPVQRLLALCRGGCASPYETDEILFASTVAGLVRR